MATSVDSSVLLDVFTEDPQWLEWSEARLTEAAQRGALIVNSVIIAEISPRFPRVEELRSVMEPLTVVEEIPFEASFLAGRAHLQYRRAGGERIAVLPDFLIGAHAAVTGRSLLTRDPRRVATYIPGAKLIAPDVTP